MEEKIVLEIFAKRLSELIKNNRTDVVELATKLGLKSKSTIYRYMNAQMEPKIPTLKMIADIYNVNPIWLMGYDVPMKLKNIKSNSAIVFVYGKIPAGIPMECIEDIIDTEEISADMLKGGKQYFGLKVNGHSMENTYLDGDIIILEKVENCESGDDCVVMVNGNEGTFKKVIKDEHSKTIRLQPINTTLGEDGKPLFEPIIYTEEEIEKLPVKIIGKVVELRRKFKR